MSAAASFRYGTRLRLAALGTMFACQQLAHALPGAAPDLTSVPLEQLLTMEVFGASRFAQKASEAPAAVTVITADEIRAFGWRTLADVVRSVRGMHVSYDRNYSFLAARGFQRPGDYNARFLLLLDGQRLNDGVYDQAPVGEEFPVELDLIERIEFVPGPGSSVYGSNAFFGVINVITRSAGAAPETRVAVAIGQAGLRKASASHARRSQSGLELLLAASRYTSSGRDLYFAEYDNPGQNHGLAQGLDYERGNRFFARAAYGQLALTLVAATRLKGVPTASYAQAFNDRRAVTDDRQVYATLAWRGMLGEHEEVNLRLTGARYDSQGDYVTDDDNRTLNRDGSEARWWNGDLRVVSTRWPGHKLLAGYDFQRDTRLNQASYDFAPYRLLLDDTRSGTRAGVYLQDEATLGPSLLLNLGLRHDHSSGQHGVTSPRVALIWQAGPQTTVKAIHGTAFRAPNSFEKYYAYPGAGGQLPNPALESERIVSNELVLTQVIGENARLSASLFRNALSRLVTLAEDPVDGVTHFENAGQARAQGVELDYERRWNGGAMLRTSYSLAALREGGATASLVRASAPERLFKVNLAVPLGAGWRSGAELQHVGRRHGANGDAGAFWLANLRIASSSVVAGAELSVAISNLFDRRYADPSAPEHRQAVIVQDGRTIRAELAYAF